MDTNNNNNDKKNDDDNKPSVSFDDEKNANTNKKKKKKKKRDLSPFRGVGKAIHQIAKPVTSLSRSMSSDDGGRPSTTTTSHNNNNVGSSAPFSTVDVTMDRPSQVSHLGDTMSTEYGSTNNNNFSGSGNGGSGGGTNLSSSIKSGVSVATHATTSTAKTIISIPKKIVQTTVKGVTKTAEFTHHETAKLLGSHHGHGGGGGRKNKNKKNKLRSPRESIYPVGVAAPFKDEILPTMEPMFTKYLMGVTVEEWAETCWLDGIDDESPDDNHDDTNEPSSADIEQGNTTTTTTPTSESVIDASSTVFGSFLEATGNTNVVMERWQTSTMDDVDGFQGDWDKEPYSMRRVIHYDKPGGGFSSGPIKVKQTQNFRYQSTGPGDDDDDNKVAIVAFTVNILSGIPYNDAFEVQVRWVATPMPVAGPPVLRLRVGCYVAFSKKVMVAGIIKSNTISSSLDDQTNTLEAMKSACNATEVPKPKLVAGVGDDDEVNDKEGTDEDSEKKKHGMIINPFVMCWTWFFNGLVWICSTLTSAIVKSVLDNETVQESGARFLVNVVETASEDPEFGETIQRLFPPQPPPMVIEKYGSTNVFDSMFHSSSTHSTTNHRSDSGVSEGDKKQE